MTNESNGTMIVAPGPFTFDEMEEVMGGLLEQGAYATFLMYTCFVCHAVGNFVVPNLVLAHGTCGECGALNDLKLPEAHLGITSVFIGNEESRRKMDEIIAVRIAETPPADTLGVHD